jgi:hypothetical protein
MAKSQIIKDLANGKIDTQTALKRTKVLLKDLKNNEILQWIAYELEGYPDRIDVPAYRKIRGQLIGTYYKGSMASHMTYNNVPLPLGNMPVDDQVRFLTTHMGHSIEALKRFTMKNNDLCKSIPADCYPWIARYNNDPYMIIVTAEIKLNMAQIFSIFSTVENKLLDVLLLLEKEFGNLDELDIDVDGKSEEEIHVITNNIYYFIYEDKKVTIGNNNKISESDIGTTIGS